MQLKGEREGTGFTLHFRPTAQLKCLPT